MNIYWFERYRREIGIFKAEGEYAFQQQRLLQAMRTLQLIGDSDVEQLRRESEADLFLSVEGIIGIIDHIGHGNSSYLGIWRILDKLEADLSKHPLRHKDTHELLQRIQVLRQHRAQR